MLTKDQLQQTLIYLPVLGKSNFHLAYIRMKRFIVHYKLCQVQFIQMNCDPAPMYHNLISKFVSLFSNGLGSCVFCAPFDRHIGQHVNRHLINVSVYILTYAWPTYWLTLGQYIDRDMSVEISTDISASIGHYVN